LRRDNRKSNNMATIEERLKDASSRLLILAACGFARTVEHLLADERSRDALETAERFADGLATREEVRAAASAAGEATESAQEGWTLRAAWAVEKAVEVAAESAQEARAAEAAAGAAWDAGTRFGVAETAIPAILDCILPPRIQFPFPGQVKGLATTIYEKRDWKFMPILADALEEIGLEEMAAHCRCPIHAKGCYALDSILAFP